MANPSFPGVLDFKERWIAIWEFGLKTRENCRQPVVGNLKLAEVLVELIVHQRSSLLVPCKRGSITNETQEAVQLKSQENDARHRVLVIEIYCGESRHRSLGHPNALQDGRGVHCIWHSIERLSDGLHQSNRHNGSMQRSKDEPMLILVFWSRGRPPNLKEYRANTHDQGDRDSEKLDPRRQSRVSFKPAQWTPIRAGSFGWRGQKNFDVHKIPQSSVLKRLRGGGSIRFSGKLHE